MTRPPRPRSSQTGLAPTVLFTRAEARAAGLRIAELRGPRFQKVFYDLYVAASVQVTAVVRARAALKISPPRSSASHFTAAEVWGGWGAGPVADPCQRCRGEPIGATWDPGTHREPGHSGHHLPRAAHHDS
ncbi:MAG: hypothetical protein H0X54_08150 [Propionibacteriales bacterium]|nr:hypothetical protein [Propionibacteriales bacterium]